MNQILKHLAMIIGSLTNRSNKVATLKGIWIPAAAECLKQACVRYFLAQGAVRRT
jgi:hypothetical protein